MDRMANVNVSGLDMESYPAIETASIWNISCAWKNFFVKLWHC